MIESRDVWGGGKTMELGFPLENDDEDDDAGGGGAADARTTGGETCCCSWASGESFC